MAVDTKAGVEPPAGKPVVKRVIQAAKKRVAAKKGRKAKKKPAKRARKKQKRGDSASRYPPPCRTIRGTASFTLFSPSSLSYTDLLHGFE